MNNRYLVALVTGAVLGIFCVIGAQLRYPNTVELSYVFSFWFNRLLMGAFFGLLPKASNHKVRIVRGLGLGLFVSFAFYSSTNYFDIVGFLAGGVYGVIIESTLYQFDKKTS